jgi:hypothetical protein
MAKVSAGNSHTYTRTYSTHAMNDQEYRLLAQQIAAQTWSVFQRMIHDLTKKEHPNALPLAAPDGGADTLIPAQGDRPTEVVQAKHYPSRIHWTRCAGSITEGLANHAPGRIMLAFPIDFTKNHMRSFQELVARFPHVEIVPWTLSDIIATLEKHPDVRKRYFGRELHEDNIESIRRVVKHGGRLETGADLVEHARSLAEFADEHDRDFRYGFTGVDATMPAPKWDDLPYITLAFDDAKTTVHINAWTREGANVPLPGFSFTDDDAGRVAKELVREELASGRDAVLRSGVRIQIPNAPKVLHETTGGNSVEMAEIRICVSDATHVDFEIETDTETVNRMFPLRWVPPDEAGHVAFACREGGIWIELDFEPLEEPTVRFGFKLTAAYGEDVSTNLEAAQLLDAFFRQKRMVLRADNLFPGGEVENRGSTGSDEQRNSVAARLNFYDALAMIERHSGVDFVLPGDITEEDFRVITTIKRILETGGGTATFENATGVVQAHEIAALGDNTRGPRVMHRPVIYELFGQSVNLGVAEYEIPPVRVVEVKPLGTKPDAPARVTLAPEGDDQMPFRLIEMTEAA